MEQHQNAQNLYLHLKEILPHNNPLDTALAVITEEGQWKRLRQDYARVKIAEEPGLDMCEAMTCAGIEINIHRIVYGQGRFVDEKAGLYTEGTGGEGPSQENLFLKYTAAGGNGRDIDLAVGSIGTDRIRMEQYVSEYMDFFVDAGLAESYQEAYQKTAEDILGRLIRLQVTREDPGVIRQWSKLLTAEQRLLLGIRPDRRG
ncbi:MAG: hypothetical protein GXP63_04870 [DPANN group archaeon]|nr:hypothetical protein [DPANN group archaeon]